MSTCQRVDCFSVFSSADPSALPRILEIFTLNNLIPEACHAIRDGSDGLVIDLQLADLPEGQAEQLARRLQRVVTVTQVLWSEKRQAAAAA